MTAIFLATTMSGNATKTLLKWDNDRYPLNILISFAYLQNWRRFTSKHYIKTNALKLDSGAYTAWSAGKSIDIHALIAETKKPEWTESVALDVIGDAQKSVDNAFYMKAHGSKAYPVFHYGDPFEHLAIYKENFPKVGLSCRFGEKEADSYRWLDKCFAKAWPYKFHSFGWTKEQALYRYPFHSADSSTWAVGPAGFGSWKLLTKKESLIGAGTRRIPVRGSATFDLRAQLHYFYELQQKLACRWQKELKQLETIGHG